LPAGGDITVKKLIALVAVVALSIGMAGSALAADEDYAHTGRVMFVTGGDVEIASNERADLLVVIDGEARVSGTVNTLIVIDGTATVVDATLETLTVINGSAHLAAGTTIADDVLQFGSEIERSAGVEIGGSIKNIAGDVASFGIFIGFAVLAIWIGFGIATLIAGLLVAGLAARQVRVATQLIRREPGRTVLVGVLSLIVLPVLAIISMATIIGLPAGLGLLVVVLPAIAFIGYIVAAIWLGEWLLGRREGAVPAERPYAAATVGLIVAFVLGLVPLVSAVLSVLGFGAVVLAAWRTFRGRGLSQSALQTQPAAA
jgi:hypothetical protein